MGLPKCCLDFDLSLEELLFPERLAPEGRVFLAAHGVGRATLDELRAGMVDLGEGRVKVYHRCDQLLDDGRCAIYSRRPQACRDFDCSTRSDCECEGRGFIALEQIA